VIGTAQLVVCQPRQPCFKFALRFDDDQVVHAMLRNGRSGWYYRVACEGALQAGDPLRAWSGQTRRGRSRGLSRWRPGGHSRKKNGRSCRTSRVWLSSGRRGHEGAPSR
jgi:MOSC domain-containing protein YiiM